MSEITPFYQAGGTQFGASTSAGFGSLIIDALANEAGPARKKMKQTFVNAAVQTAKAVLSRDSAGYVQRTEAKRKDGRKISKKARAVKVLTSNICGMVSRFQFLDPMNDSDGLPFKLNYKLTPLEDGSNEYPFYLFDLTSMPNRISTTPNVVHFPSVGYRLRRLRNLVPGQTEYNNRFYWSPGVDSSGVLADGFNGCYTWQLEKRASFNSSIPHAKAHLDWIDIGIGMIGAKSQPVNAHVYICQFDEKVCPGYYGKEINVDSAGVIDFASTPTRLESDGGNDKDNVLVPNDDVRNWNEFYTGLVDKFISHPMNKRDPYNVPGLKVINHQKLVFNPTAQFETDPRGHKKQFKWFKNVNRTCNFQWEQTLDQLPIPTPPAYATFVTNEVGPNIWDSPNVNVSLATRSGDSNQCAVHKNARLFMMICAESPVNGDFSVNDHASFELIIRRRHSTLST